MTCIFRGTEVFEDTPCDLIARFCAVVAGGAASPNEEEGTLIIQADVSSIVCKAYDIAGTLIATVTPSVSTVIYNTLQTSGVFAKLADGGNFLCKLPATCFPTGSTTVRVEVTILLNTGEPVRGIWLIDVINLIQS
jgi:hypothetical protein